MDGFQRVKASIRLKLSCWLSVAILAVALVAGCISYLFTYDEALELQDDTLRQVAALCAESPQTFFTAKDLAHLFVSGDEDQVVAFVFSVAKAEAQISASTPDGFHTLSLGGVKYRVYLRTLGSGLRVAAAQATEVRDESAFDSIEHTFLPMLLLVPLLIFLVSYIVNRSFRPVVQSAEEINGRKEFDLRPVDAEPLPREVKPYAVALNRLLERVACSISAQRRFLADAAHELRSPLTALSLQAERMAEAEMSAEARQRLQRLREGIERGRCLVNQLLDMARAQAGDVKSEPGFVALSPVCRRVVEDCLALAEAKKIDLGATRVDEALVAANGLDLQILIKNLLDNAIRYTPAGGAVDLEVQDCALCSTLAIEDSGPGIPPHERARVLDAFYRIQGSEELGSGLGLAIVSAIMKRIGGTVELGAATKHATGLKVTLTFPKAAPKAKN